MIGAGALMVDVGNKPTSDRVAVARGVVVMQPATLSRILDRSLEKGDVLNVARVAGIMAAKKTADLIPLCHSLMLHSVAMDFHPDPYATGSGSRRLSRPPVRRAWRRKSLTAVSVAALRIYDMCKAVDKNMVIDDLRLVRKTGGRSGDFVAGGELFHE